MKFNSCLLALCAGLLIFSTFLACEDDEAATVVIGEPGQAIGVDASYFAAANAGLVVTTVACTLSDGTETECFQIVSNGTPTDHQLGPWCPDNIADDASAGGIWLDNG